MSPGLLRVKILLIVGMEEADKIDTLEIHVSKKAAARISCLEDTYHKQEVQKKYRSG